jgi:YcaO-like protein with predicted kinase domain
VKLQGSGVQKIAGTQRVVTAEETLERAQSVARALGVTRVANITGLDRIGIPTYSAIVPRSEDGITVYNGKGLRDIDAKVGALMESIERQTALKARLPFIEGSFRELARDYTVLDPRQVTEKLTPDYSESRIYSWVFCQELMSNREILVPAKYAGYGWHDLPHHSCFDFNCSNGLSAGNVREEAVCQGLCEVIERDAWTLADVGAHLLPWARSRLLGADEAMTAIDDFEMFPCIDLEDDPAMQLFEQAGIFPVVRDITSDLGIPTVFVAVADEAMPGFPMVHWGAGTHPNARVASRRALTEAAQSRCVDIQGVREDFTQADAPATRQNLHTRRARNVNYRLWHLGQSKLRRKLDDLSSIVLDDIQADIDHILSQLRACGVDQVIVVDFTPPDTPFSVVRVIVPALETWSVSQGRLGKRALDFWHQHA